MNHFSDTAPQSQINAWERLWEILLSPSSQEKQATEECQSELTSVDVTAK